VQGFLPWGSRMTEFAYLRLDESRMPRNSLHAVRAVENRPKSPELWQQHDSSGNFYSGNTWFKSRSPHRFSWLRFFMVFLSYSIKNSVISTLKWATTSSFHMRFNSTGRYEACAIDSVVKQVNRFRKRIYMTGTAFRDVSIATALNRPWQEQFNIWVVGVPCVCKVPCPIPPIPWAPAAIPVTGRGGL
jgi:hypothetical protein